MKDHKKHYIFLISIAVTFALYGCFDEADNGVVLPSTDSYYLEVAKGWLKFDSADYSNAIEGFSNAVDIDPLRPEAHLGLGWSYAMTDNDKSLSSFKTAIQQGTDSPDGYAAEAFVYLAMNDYEVAIESANKAISLGGDSYVFSQIVDVNTNNLRLLIAECYYALGEYFEAQKQVDILNPDNGLDQNSRNYERDLLLEIELLKPDNTIIEDLTN